MRKHLGKVAEALFLGQSICRRRMEKHVCRKGFTLRANGGKSKHMPFWISRFGFLLKGIAEAGSTDCRWFYTKPFDPKGVIQNAAILSVIC